MFSWKAGLGAEMCKQRSEQKVQEAIEAKKPKQQVKVVEDDMDMFS